ncbi:MAG TPA: DUF354 domain-containing protein [Acidobacteriota bacterium]
MRASGRKKIWIDLENSPHVPFFAPIIEELETHNYSVMLTARDCFQVLELVDLFHLSCKRIGHHYGKSKMLKVAGLCARAAEMMPAVLGEKPELALSHGSRAQLLLSSLLGIPSVTIFDYEHVNQGFAFIHPSWVMVPDVIPDEAVKLDKNHILRYPGIKEDVYVPMFRPDPSIRYKLGINGEDLVVTVRPPASEAHYHNPLSDELFNAVIEWLSSKPGIKIVLLPRNDKQAMLVGKSWPRLFAEGKIIIPSHVVDGLNLIWFSDVVISGGGTMNREAAALDVPVYSIFRGRIGAVDRYLAASGRLVLIEGVDQVHTKIRLVRRERPANPKRAGGGALQAIVGGLVAILERNSEIPQPEAK